MAAFTLEQQSNHDRDRSGPFQKESAGPWADAGSGPQKMRPVGREQMWRQVLSSTGSCDSVGGQAGSQQIF